jgi:hypothetical protein
MLQQQLELKILALTQLAKSMDEPDRTFKLNEIDQLTMQLQGLAFSDLNAKLAQVKLTDIQTIDEKITAVQQSASIQKSTVEVFDFSLTLIKTALAIAR